MESYNELKVSFLFKFVKHPQDSNGDVSMNGLEKVSGNRLYDYMQDFIRLGWRRAGTPEAHQTARYIVEKLEQFGLEDVRLEPFEMLLYSPNRWELRIKCDAMPNNETMIECFPAWHSHAREKGVVEGELIYVGLGTSREFKPHEVQDKVVVVDSYRMMNFFPSMDFFRAYERARKAGAAGFIGIHDTPPGTIFAEFATRHQTLKDSNLESGNIPSLYLGFEAGQYLKALIRGEDQVTASILLDTTIRPALTDNLIGTLPGQKKDEIILVGTHIDSWFDGAIDNAGGNAGFLELADYFSKIPEKKREKTMVFGGFAGHEVGSIGVIEFAKQHQAWFDKITAYCMVDGFGSKGYILESPTRGVTGTQLDEAKGLFTTDNQVLFEILSNVVFKYRLFPCMHVSAVAGPYSDLGPLVAAKVPSIMLIGKGIFYHTIEDTADKVLPDQLERTAKAHVEILHRIHQTSTQSIKQADRKGIEKPTTQDSANRGDVYFNFNILPNPMIRGTTALLYITSYIAVDRIIVDLKWTIGSKEIHSPILPQLFNRAGQHKVTLTLIDNFGNEYTINKQVFVIDKPTKNYFYD